jgi:hypothetical protein
VPCFKIFNFISVLLVVEVVEVDFYDQENSLYPEQDLVLESVWDLVVVFLYLCS